MTDGLEILPCAGEGYHRVVDGPKWTVAALNYAERFDEKNLYCLERHNLTDETFVLLDGAATLLIGEKAERVPMRPLTCYNVKRGTWHNILVTPGTHTLIAENSDTAIANSDYLILATGEISRGVRPTRT